MYDTYFGFSEMPFENNLDQRFFFPGESHVEALAALLYFVNEGKGFALLCGDVGTGKTMLINSFLDQLPESVRVIIISSPNADYASILGYIGRSLGITAPAESSLQLFDQIKAVLQEARQKGERFVLIIDESHLLSDETLEDIRLLSNIETRQHKLLQILLVGQYELSHRLDLFEMRQLRERININRFLSPMNPQETIDYIDHRLQVAGGSFSSCFDASCKKTIFKLTGGIPRRINLLCDHALMICAVERSRKVNCGILKRAQNAVRSDRILAPKGRGLKKRITNLGRRMLLMSACAVALLMMGSFAYDCFMEAGMQGMIDKLLLVSPPAESQGPKPATGPKMTPEGGAAETSPTLLKERIQRLPVEEAGQPRTIPHSQANGRIGASIEDFFDSGSTSSPEHNAGEQKRDQLHANRSLPARFFFEEQNGGRQAEESGSSKEPGPTMAKYAAAPIGTIANSAYPGKEAGKESPPSITASPPIEKRSSQIADVERPQLQAKSSSAEKTEPEQERTMDRAAGSISVRELDGNAPPAAAADKEKVESARLEPVQRKIVRMVEKGDTLFRIASRVYPDDPAAGLQTILRWNPGISNMDQIYPGQVLVLPLEASFVQPARPEARLHYCSYGIYHSRKELAEAVGRLSSRKVRYRIFSIKGSKKWGNAQQIFIGGYETAADLQYALAKVQSGQARGE